jgi:hypothetical protein
LQIVAQISADERPCGGRPADRGGDHRVPSPSEVRCYCRMLALGAEEQACLRQELGGAAKPSRDTGKLLLATNDQNLAVCTHAAVCTIFRRH